jgi:hypothetical protein
MRKPVSATRLTTNGGFLTVEGAMTDVSRDDTRKNDGDDGIIARKPFQFTLRTMFLVTLVVALFCSAAATFEGMALFLAVAAIAWAAIGAIYCKMRAGSAVAFIHLCGPAYAAIVVWAFSAGRDHVWLGQWKPRDIWEVTIAVGLVASTVASVGVVCTNRFRRKA